MMSNLCSIYCRAQPHTRAQHKRRNEEKTMDARETR